VTRVAIVGGGLAGLSAAYHLERLRSGDPALEITLFEAADRLGGVVRSESRDGYLIDAGPDSLLSEPPAGLALCRELGLESDLVPVEGSARTIWIFSRGRLRPLPPGTSFFTPDPWAMARSRIFSWPGLARAALEPFVPRGPDRADESVAEFFRRRVGREVVDRLLEPMMAGIYAGDLERLSAAALVPRFRDLVRTHGSLIRGMRRARRAASGGDDAGRGGAPAFFGLRQGMAQLAESLAVQLARTHVRAGRPVDIVRRSASGQYSLGDRVGTALGEYDAVAIAVPADRASGLLRPLDAALADALAEIRYVSTAIVFLGYDTSALSWIPAGHGLFVPGVERRALRGATFVTHKFEGRSPPGRFLLRASIGGAGREEIVERSDDEIVERVRAGLRAVVGWTAEPELAAVYHYPKMNAQYEVGHLDRVRRITEGEARHPGLALAGAAYRGSGIPAVLADGRRAATQLVGCGSRASRSFSSSALFQPLRSPRPPR
jgi:oxygen-dependent protoporphyrinogen oxidase